MAILTQTILSAVAVTGPSASFAITTKKKTFQVAITGSAIVAIQASNDNVSFSNLFPQVSLGALLTSEDAYKFYRANVLQITSGTVTVILSIDTSQ